MNVSELPGSLQGQTMGASSEEGGSREVPQMPRTCTGHDAFVRSPGKGRRPYFELQTKEGHCIREGATYEKELEGRCTKALLQEGC